MRLCSSTLDPTARRRHRSRVAIDAPSRFSVLGCAAIEDERAT